MSDLKNLNFKLMEKLIRNSSSNCCGGNYPLSVIVQFGSSHLQTQLMAVCSNCETKYSLDLSESLDGHLEDNIVCDINTRECYFKEDQVKAA